MQISPTCYSRQDDRGAPTEQEEDSGNPLDFVKSAGLIYLQVDIKGAAGGLIKPTGGAAREKGVWAM